MRVDQTVAIVFLLSSASSVAFADGGLFTVDERLARDLAETDQRAVVCHADGMESLLVQTRFEGAKDRVAWVIPVPGKPAVALGDAGVFEEVESFRSSGARVPGRGGMLGGTKGASSVEVHSRKIVGELDTAVVSATDGGGLAAWLKENGFALPKEVSPVLAELVKEKSYFVAAKPKDGAVLAENGWLPPLAIRFPTAKAMFPMRLSQFGASRTEIVVYRVIRGSERLRSLEIKDAIASLPKLAAFCPGLTIEHAISREEMRLLPGQMRRDWSDLSQSHYVSDADTWHAIHAALSAGKGTRLEREGLEELGFRGQRSGRDRHPWSSSGLDAKMQTLATALSPRFGEFGLRKEDAAAHAGHLLLLVAHGDPVGIRGAADAQSREAAYELFHAAPPVVRETLREVASDATRAPEARFYAMFYLASIVRDFSAVSHALAMRSGDKTDAEYGCYYLSELHTRLSPKPPAPSESDASWNAWMNGAAKKEPSGLFGVGYAGPGYAKDLEACLRAGRASSR